VVMEGFPWARSASIGAIARALRPVRPGPHERGCLDVMTLAHRIALSKQTSSVLSSL